jgi:hypothetical protein
MYDLSTKNGSNYDLTHHVLLICHLNCFFAYYFYSKIIKDNEQIFIKSFVTWISGIDCMRFNYCTYRHVLLLE